MVPLPLSPHSLLAVGTFAAWAVVGTSGKELRP